MVESSVTVGLEAISVEVEVDVSNGLPVFDIVGLPNPAVREARERVRSALKNSGFEFPLQRITVNLAPADIKKEGAALDVAIALGILGATGQIAQELIENLIVAGELSLDGTIRPVTGVISMAMMLKNDKSRGIFKQLVIPRANYHEASLIQGIKIAPVSSLKVLIEYLKGENELNVLQDEIAKGTESDGSNEAKLNFSDVRGQYMAKRALEIAAAGGHNVLMIGSPGSGKTMLAKRLTTIMPSMALEEALEVTQIYSIAGMLPKGQPLIDKRPFRSPHHSASSTSLIGGGRIPKPGEISLSHNGILFLDEFPEFKRDVLEALRQPLEDGSVMISRVNASIAYPANLMLVAAMNPCPCGYLGDTKKECLCTPAQVMRYRNRLSGPLLDRIDMHIDVPRIEIEDIISEEKAESSEDIRKRVEKARSLQADRYNLKAQCNARIGQKQIKKYCSLNKPAQSLLKESFKTLNLSARAYNKILKVARTIADLAGAEIIDEMHIAEALQYRSMDKKYW